MYWDDVLRDVLDKKKNINSYQILNDCQDKYRRRIDKSLLRSYKLGEKYGDIYFTRREAECMVWLLKGKTINRVASELKLSPRTVEFYLKNMKAKLRCRTKFELIDLIHESEFLSQVDFV
jgi:DNA-binding CsgD family transcriptional regulator